MSREGYGGYARYVFIHLLQIVSVIFMCEWLVPRDFWNRTLVNTENLVGSSFAVDLSVVEKCLHMRLALTK